MMYEMETNKVNYFNIFWFAERMAVAKEIFSVIFDLGLILFFTQNYCMNSDDLE